MKDLSGVDHGDAAANDFNALGREVDHFIDLVELRDHIDTSI